MQVLLYNLKPGNCAQNLCFLNKFNTILSWLPRHYYSASSSRSYFDVPDLPWAVHWRAIDVIPGGNVSHRANMHCVINDEIGKGLSLQCLAGSRKKGAAWVSRQGLVFCCRLNTTQYGNNKLPDKQIQHLWKVLDVGKGHPVAARRHSNFFLCHNICSTSLILTVLFASYVNSSFALKPWMLTSSTKNCSRKENLKYSMDRNHSLTHV